MLARYLFLLTKFRLFTHTEYFNWESRKIARFQTSIAWLIIIIPFISWTWNSRKIYSSNAKRKFLRNNQQQHEQKTQNRFCNFQYVIYGRHLSIDLECQSVAPNSHELLNISIWQNITCTQSLIFLILWLILIFSLFSSWMQSDRNNPIYQWIKQIKQNRLFLIWILKLLWIHMYKTSEMRIF